MNFVDDPEVCDTVLDISHKTLLGLCIIIFGILGSLLNIWLLVAFCLTSVLVSRTYLPFLSYCIVTLCQEVLTGYFFTSASSFYGRWIFGTITCRLFALFNTMLKIFEKLNIALIAVEEYILTKQGNKEKELPFMFYIGLVTVCWLSSFIVSVLPLVGYGEFHCDLTGVKCDLNWCAKDSKNIIYNIIVFVLEDVVPFMICYFCLRWSSLDQERSSSRRIRIERRDKRKTVVYLCIMMFFFNIPETILKFILLLNTTLEVYLPISLIILATLVTEASKMFPVLLYLMCEPNIRKALVNAVGTFKFIKRKKYQVSKNINE